jgi:hypothetical protein
LKDGRTSATKAATQRNKDLSAIVVVKPTASGDKLSLDGAANQFFSLPLQTRDALGEVEDAP